MDRHKPGYYKEYYQSSPKAKEKAKTQAQKQKAERHQEWQSRPRCSVCGKPFSGRSITSQVTLDAGVHKKCDIAAWMRVFRHHNPPRKKTQTRQAK